jgi:ribonuclease VapC
VIAVDTSALIAIHQKEPEASAFARRLNEADAARLNCGDCASYALAKSRRIPLLFKGADFAHTDIRAAIASPPA